MREHANNTNSTNNVAQAELLVRVTVFVPDPLHRRAKASASLQGIRLGEFALNAIRAATEEAETQLGSQSKQEANS